METGFQTVPIARIQKAGWNYKAEDAQMSEKLKANFERNGQIENIIIRELPGGDFEVINGNHRIDVMRDLGYADAYCYNLGNVSLVEAQRIALETNETKFHANPIRLAEILKNITPSVGIEGLARTVAFSPAQINAHIIMGTHSDSYPKPPDITPTPVKETKGETYTVSDGDPLERYEPDAEQTNATVKYLTICLPMNVYEAYVKDVKGMYEENVTDAQIFEEMMSVFLLQEN